MIKPPLVTLCSILGIFTLDLAFAGSVTTTTTTVSSSVQGVAEREIVRRQESVIRARAAMEAGDLAMKAKDYEVAVVQYRTAVNLLPECVELHDYRKKAMGCYCTASVLLAEQRITEGRYGDAELAVKAVLAEGYDPHCKAALELLAHLEEPDYYNKTITPKFHANVEQVKQWLVEANGFYSSGQYDLAFKRYDQVLGIDKYNATARAGQERVNLARASYNEGPAYNETRSELLWRLSKGWEMQPRKYGSGPIAIIDAGGGQSPNNTAQITAKLNRIIIPRVEFRDATVREAIDFLKQKSRDLDVNEADPARRGVNIVLQLDNPGAGSAPLPPPIPADTGGIPGLEPATTVTTTTLTTSSVSASDARITLSLSNVPLMEVLRYITSLAGLKVKIDPYAVAVVPLTVITDQLITKEYKVPPGFLGSTPSGATSNMASPSAPTTGSGRGIASRQSAREYLEAQGVQFPPGSSANFIPSSSRLIARNTADNLDLIDTIVEAQIITAPSQVEIEAKFVEISQNNLKELSFDWRVRGFNIPGSDRVFGAGGDAASYDPSFVSEANVTAGVRSGGNALSANAIDALLFPSAAGSGAASPATLSIAGVFTDPQFQVVMRALNQKKGVDLLSAPRVTTKSGVRANIEIIREFKNTHRIHPAPDPQTIQASTSSGLGGGGGTTSIPVTPTTPTAFETRNTGVTLEVEPVVGPDGATIDLNLIPQVVEFEGFINYGSPILSPGSASFVDAFTGLLIPGTPSTVITPNVINQPIFSTRKVSTSVSVWDGQTVVLGGLMREDVQKVEDKVPFLGDIPFIGRAFRSSVDQHLKRNLVIFVTARLINPAGEPVNQEDEKEEVVQVLGPALEAPLMPQFMK